MSLNPEKTRNIIEAALMAAGQPLSIDRLLSLFMDEQQPSREEIRACLEDLQSECAARGVELKEVSSGFRYQAKQDYAEWVSRLWEEKPPRYSRALLETLALIAYRQPITRGDIEDVRGVTVSSNIIKTLLERDWVKVVGHRDVPGKPAMYATTRQFLDYFDLKNLSDLPTLAEIRDIDTINAELDFLEPGAPEATASNDGDSPGEGETDSDSSAVAETNAETAEQHAVGESPVNDQGGDQQADDENAVVKTDQVTENTAEDLAEIAKGSEQSDVEQDDETGNTGDDSSSEPGTDRLSAMEESESNAITEENQDTVPVRAADPM